MPAKALDEVRREAGGAGDETSAFPPARTPDRVPELLDRRLHFARRSDRHHELDGLGILGGNRTDDRAAGCRPSSLSLSAAASPSCAGVKAASLSMTMTAGISLESRNLACQSCASVASAPAGRKDAWSFEETSLSRPKVGPPMPAMASQATTSTAGTSQRSQNGMRGAVVRCHLQVSFRCRCRECKSVPQ